MALTKNILPFDVPPLRYGASALEPAIGAGALQAHHEEIHKGYADAVNRMLVPYPDLAQFSIEQILQDPSVLPLEIRDAALDVGGAHANHQFFWKVIGPGEGLHGGDLSAAIDRDLGGVETFRNAFTRQALDLDGPGWVYLTLSTPKSDRLEVVVLPQNGNVLTEGKPGILVCDLWDHAWAANHPDRAAWFDAFWSIVDWTVCETQYRALRQGEQPE